MKKYLANFVCDKFGFQQDIWKLIHSFIYSFFNEIPPDIGSQPNYKYQSPPTHCYNNKTEIFTKLTLILLADTNINIINIKINYNYWNIIKVQSTGYYHIQ